MSKHLGTLSFVLLLGMACGGTTDIGDESEGGTSPGGSSNGGKDSAGSSSGGGAGKASGGSVSMGGRDAGGTAGVLGFGGTIIVVAGNTGMGGAGVVDPRCPEYRPSGVCEDAGLACQYDYAGCLCYFQPQGVYAFCQKVDPACVGAPIPAAAPAPDPGAGGFSTKIALPPRMSCTCSAGMWGCGYGP